jgi:GNAT superfamily N-acetyltransferase
MTTQITPAQMEIYRKAARDREIHLRGEVDKRRKRAWELAHQAAHILKTDFGASRVVAFGSLLAHPFLTKQFMDVERENISNVSMPIADVWVAEYGEKVIGFIALLGNEVGAIFVQPAYHGMGIGLALMNTAQALHGDLEVEVFEKNSIGRRFYARLGLNI